MENKKMPLVAHLCVFEQDYFLRESILSIVNFVDKIIVIEGAWGTCINSNGGIKRSQDNTFPILKELQSKYPYKIEVHYLNEPTQLDQRSKHFELFPYPHQLWIVDSDEIYTPEDAQKVIDATKRTDFEFFDATALTFVNDAYHYTDINFPRLFRIDTPGYKFIDPNHLIKSDGSQLKHCKIPISKFYHYSFIITGDRMKKKIADRINVHGAFKWELQNNWIKRKGVKLKRTNFKPDIVANHQMLQQEAPKEAFVYKEPEKIGFLINSGLGNAILSTPMLKAIRLLEPTARISIFNWERTQKVFSGLNCIDDNIMPEHYEKFAKSIGGLDYLLLSPTAHLNPPELFKQAKHVIKAEDKGGVWKKHESEYNMELAEKLGYDAPQPNPSFFTSIMSPEDNYAAISIGYLKDSPQWALKQIEDNNEWIEPCKKLLKKGLKLFFLGASDDFIVSQEVISKLGHTSAMNLCGATSIKLAAAIIKGATLFMGLDGGLAHIAACYRVPSVITWTFTNYIKNSPLNPNIELIMFDCENRHFCQHGHYKKCEHKKCRKIKSFHIEENIEKILK